MSRHPIDGVVGAKPRVPTGGNGAPVTKEQLAALNHEYLRARNTAMAAKAEISALELARRRGELIPKKAAFDSLSYILACFQRRCRLAPRATARRLVTLGLVDTVKEHAVSQAVLAAMDEMLTELANMPGKVTNPETWLAELEREELGTAARERTPTPGEHKHAQAQAAHRAARKLETQRKRRAS